MVAKKGPGEGKSLFKSGPLGPTAYIPSEDLVQTSGENTFIIHLLLERLTLKYV